MSYCPFPKNFLWGAATAAYQVEGAAQADGRGPSVWDIFCRRPGMIAEDHTGDRSTDHYHLYKEDVALMKDVGLKAYRFSVSWSRVFPNGTGAPNENGIDFYERLVDELLAADIQPWMTLFHWDLPQALEDNYGGWESRDCAQAFADYADFMARRLGDRVKGIFTFNEFFCFLDRGYGHTGDVFAPGKRVPLRILNQARHNTLYAHGLAVQAIRAACTRSPLVGLAENAPSCVPLLETPEHIAAARTALRDQSAMFLTPIMEGAYDGHYLETVGADAPQFTEAEMKVISTPLDFVGVNLYAPSYIRHDLKNPRGWSVVPFGKEYPHMLAPWIKFGPSVLYWVPRLLSELWKPKAIYITENGCADGDRLNENGEVLDLGRTMYLQEHLAQVHRAVSEGYPVNGYFLWSLLDNFEWTSGYTERFGLIHVNYETLVRTPKLSAQFYRDVIQRNALGLIPGQYKTAGRPIS